MQCPECGTTGMTRYSKPEVQEAKVLWTCPECGWIGNEEAIKTHETKTAQKFVKMCEESLNPDYFGVLMSQIIPAIEEARRLVVVEKR